MFLTEAQTSLNFNSYYFTVALDNFTLLSIESSDSYQGYLTVHMSNPPLLAAAHTMLLVTMLPRRLRQLAHLVRNTTSCNKER